LPLYEYEESSDQIIPIEVLSLVPEESAQFYKIIPLDLKEGVLKIGLVNPDDIKAKEAMTFLARKQNYQVEFYLISPHQ